MIAAIAPATSWQRTMIALVDDVYASDDGPPPGTLPMLFATAQNLRAARAEPCHIDVAERIALAMHRLHDSLRIDGRCSTHAAAHRRDLRRSVSDWLADQPIAAFA